MPIRSFVDEEVELFYEKGRVPRRKGWANITNIVKRKIDMLHYAKELKDLRSPPQNRLEMLSKDLSGYYSIRINNQWRVIFKWDTQPYAVDVIDYH